MKLIDVGACPVSGDAGTVKIASVGDAYFGTEGEWSYRENPRTGHVWLDRQPAPEHIHELYVNYYTHAAAASGTSVWQRAQALVLARRLGYPHPGSVGFMAQLVSRLPSVADAAEMEVMRVSATKSGTLLDVGCGSGAFLQRMRDAGWQVTGTEPDPNAAARLRERLGFPVFSRIEEVESRVDRFDLITLSHVIEHVPDPLATLRQLAALLTPNGQLMVTTPNVKGLGARLFGPAWRGLEPPRHFNVFSPQSLAEAVRSAGLHVDVQTTHVRLARGIFYLSTLARRGHRDLENRHRKSSRPLKIAGYCFQLLEAALVRVLPGAGEELYCVASIAPSASKRST